jgi:hypothetical protein
MLVKGCISQFFALYKQLIRKWLFRLLLVVENPQPNSNKNQTQNQKRLFLQKLIEDEVVGRHSLLQLN